MTGRFDWFVVFADMRTGSNFLETNLNALDGVTCHGEAFNPHFIAYPKQDDILGINQERRDEDPHTLLTAIRDARDGLHGFRYFNDHDPRVFDAIMDDPRCAKIILTRNPAESYVSWKIAHATGQWKLTDVKGRKDGRAVFDAEEFDQHIATLQAFQLRLLQALQHSGQTAFYVSYEDLQSLEVMNGLATFLDVPGRLSGLDTTLKVQNPESLADKVENYDDMAQALAGIDRYNLTRTPNFEPRRSAAVPNYVATPGTSLVFMPMQGGPNAVIEDWLAASDGVSRDDLVRDMNQRSFRNWKRTHPGHRSFTVLRHPLMRAHAVFCDKILSAGPASYPKIRRTLVRRYKLPVPVEGIGPETDWSRDQHYTAFSAYLTFLKGNLSGQTAVRVDTAWASQLALLQGFSGFLTPDLVLREDELDTELALLSARFGLASQSIAHIADPEVGLPLAEIYDGTLEGLCRAAYKRDYIMFGFGDWGGR